jgi:predicted secreted Zn-dependent protease
VSARTGGILLAAMICVAGAVPTVALADPIVSEVFKYYDVDGETAQDLRADLNRRGPIDGNEHRRFDAVTHWYVRWQYTYRASVGGCEIVSVSTKVDVTYAFPRLTGANSAPSALRKAFGDYLERLLVHEKGHAQTAIDIARRIEDGIRALPPAPTCSALEAIANNLGHSLIKEANRIDVEYDARTDHGRTQGARFP